MPKNHIDLELTEKGLKLYIQTHPRDELPYQHKPFHNGKEYLMLETSNSEDTDRLLDALVQVVDSLKREKVRASLSKDINDKIQDIYNRLHEIESRIAKNDDSGVA